MLRSTLRTSMRYVTVFLAALLLALIISSSPVFGVTACSLEPNTYDPAQFDRVLENFEQTTTLRLEGPDWDNTLVRNCKVHDTGADGIFIKNVRNVVVQNCEVWNTGNTGRGIKLSSWGGTENITIDGNYVHDTGEDGIWSGGDVTAGVDHKNLKVLNNTIENTGIGDVTQGRHPIYLQSQDPLIEGNTITGPRDGNGISIRSSGIVRCNSVSGTSRTGRPAIRYYSNHEVGSTNLLVIELNNVVSDTIGIDLYPPADRADGQSPPNHVVKNFIIRYNTVKGNPDIRVVSEYYDNPIYSVEVYDNPPSGASPPVPDPTPSTVLLANFMNGNTAAFHSRVYLFNPSTSAGNITVRVFTLPVTGGLAQELPGSPLNLGSLGAKSALNLKLAEDVLNPLGIPTPYTTDGGNLTLEFTIQAAGVRGTAQVFNNSLTLAFGTYPLQAVPSTSAGSPTVLVADFLNGNTNFFKSRLYLFNPSASDGTVTLRVFTLPRTGGMAQELTTTEPLNLGTLAAKSALNIRLEDILDDMSIPRPYETDSGNLTLEITIQAADVVGAAQVFNSSLTLAFGTYPMQVIQ